LFALARTRSLGVIARVPFDEGALTGQIRADTKFPAGDWRAGYFAGDRPAEVERRARALAELLDEDVQSLPELALRFCLSAPAVSTVIPGMRRAAHVGHNTAAATRGPLPAALLARLDAHAWDKNWYP
jgi:aryl-alcohol dehydrogenase-like predicted oxidoreductase